jgi:hypothetical protein
LVATARPVLNGRRQPSKPTVAAGHLGQLTLVELEAIRSFASRGWLRTEGRRIVVTDVSALRRRAGTPDNEAV